MSAVVVQCPSCQARFHLSQERIPAKGARVRCSRCDQRFYVTPDGQVSQSRPGKGGHAQPDAEDDAPAASAKTSPPGARGARRPEAATTVYSALDEDGAPAPAPEPSSPPSRVAGAERSPQAEDSLDDPQFLFESQPAAPAAATDLDDFSDLESSPPPPRDPGQSGRGMRGKSQTGTRPIVAPPPPAAEPERPAAPDTSFSSEEAIPDIRAQKDELAGRRALAALSAAEQDEAAIGDDEPSSDSGRRVARQAASQRQEDPSGFEPSPSARRAEAPTAVSTRPAATKPAASAKPMAPAKAAPAASDSDPSSWNLDDDSSGSQAPLTLQRSTPPATASAPSGRTRPATSVNATRVSRAAAPAPPGKTPEASVTASIVSGVNCAVAVLLVAAGLRLLAVRALAPAFGPERVRSGAFEASSVETLHWREVSGRRVLAIRGELRGTGGTPPKVQVMFLDATGARLGAPREARLQRLPESLSGAALDAWARAADSGSRPPTDFTVVVTDAPADARRFEVELAAR